MTTKIYSWNQGDGSKLLADALNISRIKHQNSQYRPRVGDKIINWGSTNIPYRDVIYINHPTKVAKVIDKREFFLEYTRGIPQGFSVPKFWTDKEEARAWLHEGGGTRTLVARTILRGHEGAGIVLCNNPLDIVDAPLYTQYIKKKAEYRVHVMQGEAIDYVQKKRKLGFQGGDTRVRNTQNGYVFARTDIVVPPAVLSSAVAAVSYYGLDFGAVDVIWNDSLQTAFVLEINTAPGIEGTTVQKYADAFRKNGIV